MSTGSGEHDAVSLAKKRISKPWLSKRKNTSERDPIEVLRGNILLCLNKITPDNFREVFVDMLDLQMDNQKKIDVAVETIFQKAVSEPIYMQTYANLCQILGSIKFPDDPYAKVSPFRKTLLNRCQKEFFGEKIEEDELTRQIVELETKGDISDCERRTKIEDLMCKKRKLKQRKLGNVEFIGELFNLGMLSSMIIFSQCIGNLLAKRDEGHLDVESIECLALLFSTVGLKLEKECDDEMKKRAFEKSFSDFRELGRNQNYGNRIRFMIEDVIELRERGWVPRRKKETPQRIEDLHQNITHSAHNVHVRGSLLNIVNTQSLQ